MQVLTQSAQPEGSYTQCRLINPASNQLGRISKRILDEINNTCREKLDISQWKNTDDTINWFNATHNQNPTKEKATFLQFDISEFYPSITEELLDNALQFAKQYTNIDDEQESIIKACRKSVLFHNNNVWTKKQKDFDVTMGALDGAEIAEITGIYLLQQVNEFLTSVGEKCYAGLYRDDGLIYVENTNGPLLNRLEKGLHRIFKRNHLKISIEQKGCTVNFLDITLSTRNGTYRPYKKPNSKTKYVNRASNHPPSILKNIPSSIKTRLVKISSTEEEFTEAKGDYQKAPTEAGYAEKLEYTVDTKKAIETTKQKRGRRRRVTWFNPPYSKNVATNIGKEFFKLLHLHFPKSHPFHQLFNKNTVKLSYSCMANIDGIVKAHNNEILRREEIEKADQDKNCNCRDPSLCPLDKKCLRKNVVYEATVQHGGISQKYVGMTENTFKTRYNQHKTSFKHVKNRNQTELSNLIWKLKDKGIDYRLTWRLIAQAQTYKPGRMTCNLCLSEKFHILKGKDLINRNTELLNKCRHKRKFLIYNMKSKEQ